MWLVWLSLPFPGLVQVACTSADYELDENLPGCEPVFPRESGIRSSLRPHLVMIGRDVISAPDLHISKLQPIITYQIITKLIILQH